jgi:hypothetical protein
MSESIALTFGSFYFAPAFEEPRKVTQADFFEIVRRCLAGIEGVSALEINTGAVLGEDEFEFTPSDQDPELVYVGPHFGFAQVSFTLKLPTKAQNEADVFARLAPIPEQLRVQLAYGWQAPGSCVSLTFDIDRLRPRPTPAARTAYLYLKQEVDRSAEPLAFACIPPIFTHAEFYLYPSDDDGSDSLFWLRSHTLPDYHHYEYYFDPTEHEDVAADFFFELQSEVDLYFRNQDYSRREGKLWAAIEDAIDTLTMPRGENGLRALRAARRGRMIRETAILLTKFAAQRQLSSSQLESQVRSTYAGGTTRFARELIEGELGERLDYPIEQFSQLVQMFESGRIVELQVGVALLAALLGAIVGAAATLIAAG